MADRQYSEAAEERREVAPKQEKEVNRKGSEKAKEESKVVQSEDKNKAQESSARGRGVQCNSCYKYGHIARYCTQKPKKGSEASGRSRGSDPPDKMLVMMTDTERVGTVQA